MINGETYLKDFRTALNTFLTDYFDGDTHSFGGDDILFPQVTISYDRPQFGTTIPKPHVDIEMYDDVLTRRKATKSGLRHTVKQPCRFLVYTADRKRIWDKNHEIVNLLGLIFNSDAAGLAAQGLKVVRVGMPVPIALDSSQEYQVTQRIVTFQTDVIYKQKD